MGIYTNGISDTASPNVLTFDEGCEIKREIARQEVADYAIDHAWCMGARDCMAHKPKANSYKNRAQFEAYERGYDVHFPKYGVRS